MEHFSPSVSLHSGRPATTSLEVAKFFGKQHQHVMRSIDDLRSNTPESFSASNFGRAEYSDEQGKPRPMFILYRDGFMLLVMGYTGRRKPPATSPKTSWIFPAPSPSRRPAWPTASLCERW